MVGVVYDVGGKPDLEPRLATPEEERKYTKGKPCVRCKGHKALAGVECHQCAGTGYNEPPRLFVRQRSTSETPEEYRMRLREHIAERPERYYVREEVPRLDRDLEEYQRDLWGWAQIIAHAENTGEAPRNTDNCVQFRRPCQFLPVCGGETTIDDEGLYVTVGSNPELGSGKNNSPREEGNRDRNQLRIIP